MIFSYKKFGLDHNSYLLLYYIERQKIYTAATRNRCSCLIQNLKKFKFYNFFKILIFLHIDDENIFIKNKNIYDENKIFIINTRLFMMKNFYHK